MITAENVRDGVLPNEESDEIQLVNSKLKYEAKRIAQYRTYDAEYPHVGILHGCLMPETIRSLESRGFKVIRNHKEGYVEIKWG